MLNRIFRIMVGAAALAAAAIASAQGPLDRADPSVVEEELRKPPRPEPKARPPVRIERARPAERVGEAVTVGAILVEGATQLPAAAFAPVIERYAGRRLSPAELQALAGEIAGVARAAGFGLATAGIPQQRVENGILRVILDEGRIDEIRADGSGASAVERMLAPLADGTPVRTRRLERQLLAAGDLPGIRLGAARIDRRQGRNILRLRAERDPFQARASLDNWGTDAVGPVRLQVTGDVNGLFADDDRLTLGGVMTPFDIEEFALVRAGYSNLLGRDGTEAGAWGYIARSQTGASFGDIGGDSAEAAMSLSRYLARTRESGVRGSIEFGVRDSSQDRRGVRLREDRLTMATASLYAFGKLGGGRGRVRLAVVQGLDLLGATDKGDPLASRRDGSGAFTKLELWSLYDQPLGGGFSFQAQAEGQIASRALLASEEMGLGGRYLLRGYDYRERSGDNGIAGSVELRYDLKDQPKPVRAAQIYVYADAGVVGNYHKGFGDGSLASMGGGVRLGLGKAVEASLEAGFPLQRRFSGGRSPRFSFTLGTRF